MEEVQKKEGVWGLATGKCYRTAPSTTGNAVLEHAIKVAIIIDHCAQKNN